LQNHFTSELLQFKYRYSHIDQSSI